MKKLNKRQLAAIDKINDKLRSIREMLAAERIKEKEAHREVAKLRKVVNPKARKLEAQFDEAMRKLDKMRCDKEIELYKPLDILEETEDKANERVRTLIEGINELLNRRDEIRSITYCSHCGQVKK